MARRKEEAIEESSPEQSDETSAEAGNLLGAFILGLDCGYPRATDQYPNGMSATEAAVEYIKELRREVERWKEAHGEACLLVDKMHAAAVGEVTGPKRGVVEDVSEAKNMASPLSADLAPIAYDKLRVELAHEATFPAWLDLPQSTRDQYLQAAEHCQAAAPRTRYEEIVLEVIYG
jgi:hypothetical protein